MQLDLSSRDVPPRENGVTAAKGAGVIDADRAEVRGHDHRHRSRASPGTIDVIAIGEDGYLKFFTPEYEETDLDTLNAPEPRDVLRPGRGHLGAAAADGSTRRTRAGPGRAGGARQDRRHAAGRPRGGPLPPRRRHRAPSPVSYGLTDTDELRTATLVGPFFPGVEATYLLSLTDYGAPVEITRP